MGLFDKVKNLLKPSKSEPHDCASGYPDWAPSEGWKPDFEDGGVTPEEYDGD